MSETSVGQKILSLVGVLGAFLVVGLLLVVMKNSAIPQVAKDGVMQEVNFTVVDADRDSALAKQVMEGGGSLPQRAHSGYRR